MSQHLKLRTSVRPDLSRRILFKGTFLALIGSLPLIYGGVFMPAKQLEFWGLPILIVSAALITIGILPSRKLFRLEGNPNELIIEDEHLLYLSKGKETISIPIQSIQGTAYIEKGNIYGIGVWLKANTPAIHPAQKTYGCDLFFPYFSQRSQIELEEYLMSELQTTLHDIMQLD